MIPSREPSATVLANVRLDGIGPVDLVLAAGRMVKICAVPVGAEQARIGNNLNAQTMEFSNPVVT